MLSLYIPKGTFVERGSRSSAVKTNFIGFLVKIKSFELKGLRKILRVLWTAKKTNEWGFNKAVVKTPTK